MLQVVAEALVYEVPRALGWVLLKVVTLGRYRHAHQDDWITEAAVGFGAFAGVTWLCARWL
jgi:hypothetical protein